MISIGTALELMIRLSTESKVDSLSTFARDYPRSIEFIPVFISTAQCYYSKL